MNEKHIDNVVRNIVEYVIQVKPDVFENEYENFNDAFNIYKDIVINNIDDVIDELNQDLNDIQPDVLENWNTFYTCEKPQNILDSLQDLKGEDTTKPTEEKPTGELSKREQIIKEVKLMDIACHSLNDEDYLDSWLTGGVPDGATEEDYEYYADNEEDYKEIKNLFIALMQYAERDESGLYNCNEEAFKYAKQFAPKLKNTRYEDGKFIVEEDCTQAGAIAGPTGMFGVKDKKEEDNVSSDETYYYYEIHFDYTKESGKDSDGYSKFFKSHKVVPNDTPYVIDLAIDENVLNEDELNDIEFIDYAEQIDQIDYEDATGLITEGLYDNCYHINNREELKEIALNAIYVANNDQEIIKEVNERLTDSEEAECKECLAKFSKAPYDFVANNYTNMPLELLREIALSSVYVANDDESIKAEINDRKVESKQIKTESKTLEDLQMEIYELIQNSRKIDNQDIQTNIAATIDAIKLDYPEINEKHLEEYVKRKALEIYNGEYDENDLPTDEIYELLSNGLFAGEDINDNINSTVNEILNEYGTDYKEEEIRNYVEQKAQEIYANELDESKRIIKENSNKTTLDNIYQKISELGYNVQYDDRDEYSLVLWNPESNKDDDFYSFNNSELFKYLDSIPAIKYQTDDNDISTLVVWLKDYEKNKEIKTEDKLTEQLNEIKQCMESLEVKNESNDPRGDKIEQQVELNGIKRTLYWQAELDCFNAIVNKIKGLESSVENWNVDFLGLQGIAYVDFKTDDNEGTFEVKFSMDTFGTVEKVETRYSNQNVTYDFIKLAEELYKLKG